MNRKEKTSRLEAEIDLNLKRAYDEVANEAIPSQLTDLLNKLRAQDSGPSKDKGAENE